MKYDIITELKSKGAIPALDFEEQDALRKIIKGTHNGPNSVEFDNELSYALVRDGRNTTSVSISNRGRRIERGSDPKEAEKSETTIELLPAGLCHFTVTKYNSSGYRIIRFKTSIKDSHVFNQLEIKYYDYEATCCCSKNKLDEPEEKLLAQAGIIPDEEEIIQFPNGVKGRDEIFEYMNIALTNPNSSYDSVAKKLVEKGRIGANENEDNVIYLDDSNNIIINRQKKIL